MPSTVPVLSVAQPDVDEPAALLSDTRARSVTLAFLGCPSSHTEISLSYEHRDPAPQRSLSSDDVKDVSRLRVENLPSRESSSTDLRDVCDSSLLAEENYGERVVGKKGKLLALQTPAREQFSRLLLTNAREKHAQPACENSNDVKTAQEFSAQNSALKNGNAAPLASGDAAPFASGDAAPLASGDAVGRLSDRAEMTKDNETTYSRRSPVRAPVHFYPNPLVSPSDTLQRKKSKERSYDGKHFQKWRSGIRANKFKPEVRHPEDAQGGSASCLTTDYAENESVHVTAKPEKLWRPKAEGDIDVDDGKTEQARIENEKEKLETASGFINEQFKEVETEAQSEERIASPEPGTQNTKPRPGSHMTIDQMFIDVIRILIAQSGERTESASGPNIDDFWSGDATPFCYPDSGTVASNNPVRYSTVSGASQDAPRDENASCTPHSTDEYLAGQNKNCHHCFDDDTDHWIVVDHEPSPSDSSSRCNSSDEDFNLDSDPGPPLRDDTFLNRPSVRDIVHNYQDKQSSGSGVINLNPFSSEIDNDVRDGHLPKKESHSGSFMLHQLQNNIESNLDRADRESNAVTVVFSLDEDSYLDSPTSPLIQKDPKHHLHSIVGIVANPTTYNKDVVKIINNLKLSTDAVNYRLIYPSSPVLNEARAGGSGKLREVSGNPKSGNHNLKENNAPGVRISTSPPTYEAEKNVNEADDSFSDITVSSVDYSNFPQLPGVDTAFKTDLSGVLVEDDHKLGDDENEAECLIGTVADINDSKSYAESLYKHEKYQKQGLVSSCLEKARAMFKKARSRSVSPIKYLSRLNKFLLKGKGERKVVKSWSISEMSDPSDVSQVSDREETKTATHRSRLLDFKANFVKFKNEEKIRHTKLENNRPPSTEADEEAYGETLRVEPCSFDPCGSLANVSPSENLEPKNILGNPQSLTGHRPEPKLGETLESHDRENSLQGQVSLHVDAENDYVMFKFKTGCPDGSLGKSAFYCYKDMKAFENNISALCESPRIKTSTPEANKSLSELNQTEIKTKTEIESGVNTTAGKGRDEEREESSDIDKKRGTVGIKGSASCSNMREYRAEADQIPEHTSSLAPQKSQSLVLASEVTRSDSGTGEVIAMISQEVSIKRYPSFTDLTDINDDDIPATESVIGAYAMTDLDSEELEVSAVHEAHNSLHFSDIYKHDSKTSSVSKNMYSKQMFREAPENFPDDIVDVRLTPPNSPHWGVRADGINVGTIVSLLESCNMLSAQIDRDPLFNRFDVASEKHKLAATGSGKQNVSPLLAVPGSSKMERSFEFLDLPSPPKESPTDVSRSCDSPLDLNPEYLIEVETGEVLPRTEVNAQEMTSAVSPHEYSLLVEETSSARKDVSPCTSAAEVKQLLDESDVSQISQLTHSSHGFVKVFSSSSVSVNDTMPIANELSLTEVNQAIENENPVGGFFDLSCQRQNDSLTPLQDAKQILQELEESDLVLEEYELDGIIQEPEIYESSYVTQEPEVTLENQNYQAESDILISETSIFINSADQAKSSSVFYVELGDSWNDATLERNEGESAALEELMPSGHLTPDNVTTTVAAYPSSNETSSSFDQPRPLSKTIEPQHKDQQTLAELTNSYAKRHHPYNKRIINSNKADSDPAAVNSKAIDNLCTSSSPKKGKSPKRKKIKWNMAPEDDDQSSKSSDLSCNRNNINDTECGAAPFDQPGNEKPSVMCVEACAHLAEEASKSGQGTKPDGSLKYNSRTAKSKSFHEKSLSVFTKKQESLKLTANSNASLTTLETSKVKAVNTVCTVDPRLDSSHKLITIVSTSSIVGLSETDDSPINSTSEELGSSPPPPESDERDEWVDRVGKMFTRARTSPYTLPSKYASPKSTPFSKPDKDLKRKPDRSIGNFPKRNLYPDLNDVVPPPRMHRFGVSRSRLACLAEVTTQEEHSPEIEFNKEVTTITKPNKSMPVKKEPSPPQKRLMSDVIGRYDLRPTHTITSMYRLNSKIHQNEHQIVKAMHFVERSQVHIERCDKLIRRSSEIIQNSQRMIQNSKKRMEDTAKFMNLSKHKSAHV